ERGAVVRRAVLNPLDARLEGARGGRKWTIADLQFDDILALRLEAPGDGEDIEGGFGGQALGEAAEAESGAHVQWPGVSDPWSVDSKQKSPRAATRGLLL